MDINGVSDLCGGSVKTDTSRYQREGVGEIPTLRTKAHQRIIRENMAKDGVPPNIELTPENGEVREISLVTARNIILKYEWLGCMPAISRYCYGLYFSRKEFGCIQSMGHLASVVVYGDEYSENLGHWDRFGFTGKMLLLARGASVWWSPPFVASMLIRKSMKLLPPKYEVITATVDELAGEIGTVYQAAGFYYIGSMRENMGLSTERFGVIIDGKLYNSRSIRQKIGNQRKTEILKRYPNAQFVTLKTKKRYFAFRGSRKVQKKHFEVIESLIKSYPKRL